MIKILTCNFMIFEFTKEVTCQIVGTVEEAVPELLEHFILLVEPYR
jgi:hypothetical protein